MGAGYAALVAADSPQAWWRLDESTGATTAANSGSVSGIDGTYTNALPGQASLVPDDGGHSCGFSANGGVFAPSTSALDNGSGFTIEAVFTMSSLGGFGAVLDKPVGGSTNTGYQVFMDSGNIVFRTKPTSGGYVDLLYATSNLSGSSTYHLAAVWDGSTKRIYINGTQAASVAFAGPLATGAGAPTIGRLVDSGGYALTSGRLDEVAVYGTALSGSTILAHATEALYDPAARPNLFIEAQNLMRSGLVDIAGLNPGYPSQLYDGNRAHASYVLMGFGLQERTIDLGRQFFVERLNHLLYWGDTRTFINVALYGSPEGVNWTILRAPADFQASTTGVAGLDIAVNGAYRYFKIHGEGNYSFNSNEWVETEIWTPRSPMMLGGGYA